MKFIRTCFGEWVNPAQVKHFNIRQLNRYNGAEYVAVRADEVTLRDFDIEAVPDDVTNAKSRESAYAANRRRARAAAIDWLDNLMEGLGNEIG